MIEIIKCKIEGEIAVLTFNRPKVNAINAEFVNQLQSHLELLIHDKRINGIILTGSPGFFSAGLDVVELFPLGKKDIQEFWAKFNRLLITLFTCPKLIFSAISGHSPAGGTVLAIMTDYRIMNSGNYKIGLNEVAVGLTLPGAIGEVFQYLLGTRNAEKYALTGSLLTPETALAAGLIDEICEPENMLETTKNRLKDWLKLPSVQQGLTKLKMRKKIASRMENDFEKDTAEIVSIWFDKSGREVLGNLVKNLTNR